ncbi:ABC transporter ATP-binding protein [Williamsia maris]|uniref:ABC transport system ATP-binding protein n=1 Tax=Williamsia maris TaxID=72806 RepID=A0ABT1HHM1_9NOCA|nr:ABC transporter ATP-binding protein [Williamsia maris]MCP2176416.1 putative ABC transport system ATP-binding protein [Williamsia maris]
MSAADIGRSGETRSPTVLTGSRILLLGMVRNRRWLTTGSLLYGLHQITQVLVPVVIGVVIDKAVSTGDVGALVVWIAVLFGLFMALTLTWRFGARILTWAEAGEGCTLRVEVAAKILSPRGVRTDLRSGELLTISSSDADNASYMLDYIPRIVEAVTATLACAVALMIINVPLGLGVLVGTPVVLAVLHLSAPLITRRVQDQQETVGRATAVATDLIAGLRPLRGIGAQQAAAQRYRDISQSSLQATLRAARTQRGFAGVSATISNLLSAGIAIASGWLALDGHISIGQFVTVIGLAQFLIEPLTQLTEVPSWVAEARASANRLSLVFAAPSLLPDGERDPGEPPYGLQLSGLGYGSLDDVDLTVAPGEFLGVVAPNSADAEALVAVLSGRVPPEEYRGTVRLGANHLHEIEHRQAREAMVVEPHITDIFTGTLGSNITAGAPDPDPELVTDALRSSAATDVVTMHAAGLDAPVTERGSSLSGGQRQRVALARALLVEPSVLVLHDPTTAIDSVTEKTVADGITGMRHRGETGFTTVLVTSSPTLLAGVDRVVVLTAGGVVASGSHAELSETDDDYRRAVLR